MKWNVFYHDINRDKIGTYNIFKHGGFREDVKNAIKKYKDKDEFAEQLKKELMYYFWAKCEWEIILSPWVGGRNTKDIKIDVYDQVMLNWDVFLDYVWDNKKELLKDES